MDLHIGTPLVRLAHVSTDRVSPASVTPASTSNYARSFRSQSQEPNGSAVVPSPALQIAARRVAANLGDSGNDVAGSAEVAELLAQLASSVQLWQADPAAPLDERMQSPLARRLLGLLRAELVRLLEATDRVREAVDPARAESFPAQLSGPHGLELLADMVHDVRSPLTSILFLAETLQREQSGPVNELQRRQLGLIYGAALGLSSVASDLRELAQGGDYLVEEEPVPFSVSAVLESVRDIVRPIAEERRLAVQLMAPAGDHRLGHPVALSRVLLNLATNALKFTDEGYVEIVAHAFVPERVEFSVRDSGRGIDPHIVENLFQPLRRAVGRSRPSFSQTGLGLMMCRKLTAAMGAELKVETRVGWGTRFSFELSLPRCPEPGLPRAPRRVAPARRERAQRPAAS